MLLAVNIISFRDLPPECGLEDVLKVGVGCKKTHKAYAEI
jgi:hypothetical protein